MNAYAITPPEEWPEHIMQEAIFVHILGDDGKINMQGMIKGKCFDRIKVQLFSAWDGHPTNIILVDEKELFDPAGKYILYDNEAEWRDKFSRCISL
jgi:hypothetical protein